MYERFTERARTVMQLAHDEARSLKHGYIGTEHVLLGLLREEEGGAARALVSLGVTTDEARDKVVRVVGTGKEEITEQIPFTLRAKKVCELALREALSLGHNYIGTEHLLLGLVRENDGIAARVLLDCDADSEKVRDAVMKLLAGPARVTPIRPSPEMSEGERLLRGLYVDLKHIYEGGAPEWVLRVLGEMSGKWISAAKNDASERHAA